MADNNRLELVISAIDNTEGATTKARANMRNFVEEAIKAAQGASNSFDKAAVDMARSIDKGSASAMRSLEALERRAALAGKSAVGKLVEQRDQMVNSLGLDEASNQRIRAAYDKIISARQKFDEDMKKRNAEGGENGVGSMVLRRGFLAVKDFSEGRVQGTMAEAADILFGQGGSGGVVQKAIPGIAEITGVSTTAIVAIGGLTAAFAGLGLVGLHSVSELAEVGEQIRNFSLRTGIAPDRVQAFQFAAKAAGQKPETVEYLAREVSRAADDTSDEGRRKREELNHLGVNLYDQFGDLQPTEQVILGIADGLNKLPPGLERSAAAVKLFGDHGAEALPVLEKLRENIGESDRIGNTLSKADIDLTEEWKKSITAMGEEFSRFKQRVELPLAIRATFVLSAANNVYDAFVTAPVEILKSNIRGLFEGDGSAPNIPTYNAQKKFIGTPTAETGQRLADRIEADALIRRLQQTDPEVRSKNIQRQLSELGTPIEGRTSLANVQKYQSLLQQSEQLKNRGGANQALEGVIAARKEGFDLDAKYREILASGEQKRISASLNTSRELSSPEDIQTRLRLAELKANADKDKAIEDRRKIIDTKTGQETDLSGTAPFQRFQSAEESNLPKRLRNEYASVLADITAQDAKYFAARTDADGKAWEAAWQRRQRGELELQQEEINTRQSIQTRQFDIDGSTIDRQKEMALQSLDGVNAQTLQEKSALEDRKFAIEQAYAEKSLENQIAKLNNQQALDIAGIQKKASESDNTNSEAEAADIAAARDKYQQQIDAARGATTDREIIDAQKAQSAKEKLQIESNRKVYDSLKQDAAGLFDQLVFHTKSWGEFAKDLFKATILTPIKEIFASQVAGFFTKALTGQNVSFGEVGNGEGAFGRLGSVFGRAGLGQPRFGATQPVLTKLEQPGHLGDVSLVQGAVPVVLLNQAGWQKTVSNNFSFSSAAAGAGLASMLLGGARSAIGAVTSTPSFTADSTLITDPSQFGGPGASAGTFGSLSDISKLVGGPGGTSGFAGPVSGYGGSSSSGGSIFSSLGSSMTSGLGKIFSRGDGSPGGEIDPESGAPLGHDIPGSPDNSSGETGSGVGGATGGLLLSAGSGLAMDGLNRKPGTASAVETPLGAGMIGAKFGGMGGGLIGAGIGLGADGIRRGGYTGMMEDAAGGALIGFQVGGPAGAAVGAVIGGAVGFVRMFMESDRDHAKKLVKQVYGMDINNGIADQIIQIAKQSYGNQIDVAVRSPQVRDLLKLYAQATGNKTAQDQFEQSQVHSASFVESGGKLQQQAIYDNGNAYAYSSPLATYGGVATSSLSTFAPNQGVFNGNLQINLNGQSASDALAGQVVRVATPGFVQGQALAASNSSIGRTAQQNMTLSPSALRS